MSAHPGRLALAAQLVFLAAVAVRGNPGPAVRADAAGDALPAGAVARLGSVRWRNGAGVFALAFAPDGKTLALAGGAEPLIQIREVAGGKEVRDFGKQQAAVESLAFSPDGKCLAAKSGGLVRLWDVATGQPLRKFRARTYYAKQKRLGIEVGGFGGGAGPTAAAPVHFTPDGKTLVAEGGDNTLHLWEADTGKELRQLMHRGPVVSAALSPDGRRLASGCVDNAVRVWD